MQFSILNLKPSLTVSRAKLAHWASELQTTCRVLASARRMFYLQQFRQFHLGYFNAVLVISVYAAMTKQPPAQKCSKCKFFDRCSEFSHHSEIYTDGSKDGVRTAAAVVAPNSVKTVRLPDNASIFTAELHALDMALGIIRRTRASRSRDYACGLLRLFVHSASY